MIQYPPKINVCTGILGDNIIDNLFQTENFTGNHYCTMLQDSIDPMITQVVGNFSQRIRLFLKKRLSSTDGWFAHYWKNVKKLPPSELSKAKKRESFLEWSLLSLIWRLSIFISVKALNYNNLQGAAQLRKAVITSLQPHFRQSRINFCSGSVTVKKWKAVSSSTLFLLNWIRLKNSFIVGQNFIKYIFFFIWRDLPSDMPQDHPSIWSLKVDTPKPIFFSFDVIRSPLNWLNKYFTLFQSCNAYPK